MATEQVGVHLRKFAIVYYTFRSSASKIPRGYSKSVCVRLHSENSEPTINTLISQTTPDEHPPMPPPCGTPALITLHTLANFQLVWRCLCDVVLFRSSCLFEHTLTAVCVLPEDQSVVSIKCIYKFNDYLK